MRDSEKRQKKPARSAGSVLLQAKGVSRKSDKEKRRSVHNIEEISRAFSLSAGLSPSEAEHVNLAVRGWATHPESSIAHAAFCAVLRGSTDDEVRLLVDAGRELRGHRGGDELRNRHRRRRMILDLRIDLVLAMVRQLFGAEASNDLANRWIPGGLPGIPVQLEVLDDRQGELPLEGGAS